MSLAEQACVPCKGGAPPMDTERAEELLREVDEIWTHKIQGLTESDFYFAAKADRAL